MKKIGLPIVLSILLSPCFAQTEVKTVKDGRDFIIMPKDYPAVWGDKKISVTLVNADLSKALMSFSNQIGVSLGFKDGVEQLPIKVTMKYSGDARGFITSLTASNPDLVVVETKDGLSVGLYESLKFSLASNLGNIDTLLATLNSEGIVEVIHDKYSEELTVRCSPIKRSYVKNAVIDFINESKTKNAEQKKVELEQSRPSIEARLKSILRDAEMLTGSDKNFDAMYFKEDIQKIISSI